MVCNEAANEEWVVDHVTIDHEDTAEHSGEEVEDTTDIWSTDRRRVRRERRGNISKFGQR